MTPKTDAEVWSLSLGLVLFGVTASVVQTYVSAPYGKLSSTNRSWGPNISPKLGWLLMESPSIYVSAFVFFTQSDPDHRYNTVNLLLLALFIFHYIVRSLVYPFLMTSKQPMPIVVMLSAWFFCAYNGYLQGIYLAKYSTIEHLHEAHTSTATTLTQLRLLLGIPLFFVGWYINQASDEKLRSLKRHSNTYQIPRGGMFEYVSAANYFGEIIEWTGYAIASWSVPAAAFAIFTSLQLGRRGLSYHQWYQQKFRGEYPRERKAIIPFLL